MLPRQPYLDYMRKLVFPSCFNIAEIDDYDAFFYLRVLEAHLFYDLDRWALFSVSQIDPSHVHSPPSSDKLILIQYCVPPIQIHS